MPTQHCQTAIHTMKKQLFEKRMGVWAELEQKAASSLPLSQEN